MDASLLALFRPTLVLTEGPMKADVINALTGMTVLAVPGVNTLTQLELMLNELRREGLVEIKTAFDMDFAVNHHVQNGYNSLLALLGNMDSDMEPICGIQTTKDLTTIFGSAASKESVHSNSKGTGRSKFCFALFCAAFLLFMSILVVNTHNESCNEDVQIKNLEVYTMLIAIDHGNFAIKTVNHSSLPDSPSIQ